MRRRLRGLLGRWWPLPVAAVVLVLQQYGWTQAWHHALSFVGAAWPALRWAWPLLAAGLLIAWLHRPSTAAAIARLQSRRSPQLILLGALTAGALAVGALGVLLLVFVVLPPWLVPDGAIADPAELYGARNDVRATALQAVAGIVLLLGAYFTWRQVRNTREQLEVARRQAQDSDRQAREQLAVDREGQVTERFTRAIDQLGADQVDVRLGGVYALERIARDSEADQPTIAEVLTAYVRTHSPGHPPKATRHQ